VRADVGAARDAVDRFAHHDVEAASGVLGLGEQVDQAAVALEGNVDAVVGVAQAAVVEVFAAGLDVPDTGR
jgi:hypothetical protein